MINLTLQRPEPEPEPVVIRLIEESVGRIRVMAENDRGGFPVVTFYRNGMMYRHKNVGHLGFTTNNRGQIELTEEG